MKRIAAVETAAQQAQGNYTYRQSVTLEELDTHGGVVGDYREVRDIVFSPAAQRTEQFVGTPQMRLKHLKLTDEDFRDIREIQPFLLTTDQAFLYESRFRGEETMDGVDGMFRAFRRMYWVYLVRGSRLVPTTAGPHNPLGNRTASRFGAQQV